MAISPQAISQAWTDSASYLAGIGDGSFSGEVISNGALIGFDGKDKEMNCCDNGFYPKNDFSFTISQLAVSTFTPTTADQGIVSSSNTSQVLGPLNFSILAISGYCQGQQKCYFGQNPSLAPKSETCSFDFVYQQSGGIVTYILTPGIDTIIIVTVSVTDPNGNTPNPTLSITNLKGNIKNSSYLAKNILQEFPNLFSTAEFSAILINVLNTYLNQP
jgi:hypothetical protein